MINNIIGHKAVSLFALAGGSRLFTCHIFRHLTFCIIILNIEKGENIMDKYISIITNFGCHYTCPYCIVKENNLDIPKTTLNGLDMLENFIKNGDYNIISLSGGGDPLFHYSDNMEWYRRLYEIQDRLNIPMEMHTSYKSLPAGFDADRYSRIVYHLRYENYKTVLSSIKRQAVELVRTVFVVTEQFTKEDILWIAEFVKNSSEIDELSFRQMVDNHYKETYYLYDFLKAGHKGDWYYIEQNDYNTYYVENYIYDSYKNIGSADNERLIA